MRSATCVAATLSATSSETGVFRIAHVVALKLWSEWVGVDQQENKLGIGSSRPAGSLASVVISRCLG